MSEGLDKPFFCASDLFLHLDAFPQMLYVKDLDAKLVVANQALCSFLAATPDDIVGMSEAQLFGAEASELLSEMAAQAVAGMPLQDRNIVIPDGYGISRTVCVHQALISVDPDMRILTSVTDLTEQRQMEEVLRSSEEYARSFLESSRDCVAHLSTDGYFLTINAAGSDALELENPQGIADKKLTDFSREHAEPIHTAISASRGGESPSLQFKTIGRTGRLIWWDARLTPIHDFDGSIRSILLVARDITEQRKAEAEVRKLLLAVEQNPASIVITDINGTIEYVNPKFCYITGYSSEEAIGQNPRLLKTGEMSPEGYRDLWSTILSGKVWRGEFHNRKKNGELFWEASSISPIFDAEGKIQQFIAVKEDVTQKKLLEEQLQIEKNQVEQAYADLKTLQSQLLQQEKMSSIGQLAAGVAHEINNPIGFIKSNLNTLRKYVDRFVAFVNTQSVALDQYAPDTIRSEIADQKKALKIDFMVTDINALLIESIDGTERVRQIVQDLKSFSHIDEAENKLSDINQGLESTINIVWNELKYKANVTKEFGQLPMTRCNPGQLNQVFMNLLVNAAQAIESHGDISVITWAKDGMITVIVADTGGGIPPDKLNRIFEPFFTTKDVGKGTGLGLSIAYDIVKKHNGDIQVQSEVGKGTVFTVRLPIMEG
ncbi:MAG TPA: PAS domain S-box protein [Dissulfurispiraceae bacterium]|nr:PAS domain S-box protein [Dissulfurispiraceae bacterium]